MFLENILAFGVSDLLPYSQWPGYPQPSITYYRITTGGLVSLIILGIILICLVAATVYLLVVYKRRMDDLEQKMSGFDDRLRDLYRKQSMDLDKVLQHVYELKKRAEPPKPGPRFSDNDTNVEKRA